MLTIKSNVLINDEIISPIKPPLSGYVALPIEPLPGIYPEIPILK